MAALQPCVDVEDMPTAGFGKGATKALPLQDLCKIVPLLPFRIDQPNRIDNTVMVLGYLSDRSVGGGNDCDDLGKRDVRHASATVVLGHEDLP